MLARAPGGVLERLCAAGGAVATAAGAAPAALGLLELGARGAAQLCREQHSTEQQSTQPGSAAAAAAATAMGRLAPELAAVEAAGSDRTPLPVALPSLPLEVVGCSQAGAPALALGSCAASAVHGAAWRSDSGGPLPRASSAASSQFVEAQGLAAYLTRHGLASCVAVRELGRGSFGRVEQVEVLLPGGCSMPAVRKTLLLPRPRPPAGQTLLLPPRRKRGLHRSLAALLHNEVAGLQAAAGAGAHAVRLYDWSAPAAEAGPHQLLLEYVPGVSLAAHLDRLAWDEEQRDFDVLLSGGKKKKKKDKRPDCDAAPPTPFTAALHSGPTLLPDPQLRALAVAMLRTLQSMHGNGYCHADIKPENIIVDTSRCSAGTGRSSNSGSSPWCGGGGASGGASRGLSSSASSGPSSCSPCHGSSSCSPRFVVCDMGLATRPDGEGVIRRIGGTRDYASPEVRAHLSGSAPEHAVTLAADMASVGLVLADAAYSHATCGGLRAFANGECGLPPQVPTGLVDLVARLTARQPAARPSPSEALAHPWLSGA
ncbi:hypothetical protein HXX76_001545 [Chlamydomonas incerta]|uniref:Protein kinase domain-containing protein n=1 Tax=Chlamydomonas incerta TaxID=51695 RepID=A0A836B1R9_CHLIN|nr:hypothetical protein HXX76_001545 [Chlamydomonas incerta]|eukprot:KAG2444803.1 hypothetical protein HXX76_001545 [Chlamydomonas incerta]